MLRKKLSLSPLLVLWCTAWDSPNKRVQLQLSSEIGAPRTCHCLESRLRTCQDGEHSVQVADWQAAHDIGADKLEDQGYTIRRRVSRFRPSSITSRSQSSEEGTRNRRGERRKLTSVYRISRSWSRLDTP